MAGRGFRMPLSPLLGKHGASVTTHPHGYRTPFLIVYVAIKDKKGREKVRVLHCPHTQGLMTCQRKQVWFRPNCEVVRIHFPVQMVWKIQYRNKGETSIREEIKDLSFVTKRDVQNWWNSTSATFIGYRDSKLIGGYRRDKVFINCFPYE